MTLYMMLVFCNIHTDYTTRMCGFNYGYNHPLPYLNRENGIFHTCILFKGRGFQLSMGQDESLSGIRVNSAWEIWRSSVYLLIFNHTDLILVLICFPILQASIIVRQLLCLRVRSIAKSHYLILRGLLLDKPAFETPKDMGVSLRPFAGLT